MGRIHPVTVEPLQFSLAEPVAYEGSYWENFFRPELNDDYIDECYKIGETQDALVNAFQRLGLNFRGDR